ncbi:MAG TPA: flavodoxin domain-containing protein [Candidatus Limnocylindrales bacterium]|nr:flavodoxin domain-containing protein [Candidatus Limnocylindrales bacterium]
MKVLVTAASKHGATAEIAHIIGAVLETEGIAADVISPEAVEQIEGYDAVVLGSGVYAGHWLKPAKEFAERHESALRELPFFVFSSGPVGDPPKDSDEPAEIDAIDAATHPIDHQIFGGRLTPSELGPFEKLVIKVVKAPMLDDRPWDEISDWAKEIANYLRAGEREREEEERKRIAAITAATTSVVLS